jgi:hypothetical protein
MKSANFPMAKLGSVSDSIKEKGTQKSLLNYQC